jgi:hypothetical protein
MQYTTNYSLKKPQYADEADIEVINDNTDDVDTLIHQNRTMIAPAFDNTKAYVTGDPVEYLGALYVFTADKAAGAWDASKVEPTTAAEMGGGGASALADLDDVEITSPAQGQALLFDDDDDLWKNQTLPDASVTKEASGNPIELTDAASAPLVKCVTEIQGSQDLHGYDKPWVGGAGKNLYNPATETATSSALTNEITGNPNTDYTFSVDVLQSGLYVKGYDSGSWVEITTAYGAKRCTFNSGEYTKIQVSTYSSSYSLPTQLQVEKGSTATSYEPYSNICPITAYTEGEIEVRGKNLFDAATYFANRPTLFSVDANGVITQTTADSSPESQMNTMELEAGTYTIQRTPAYGKMSIYENVGGDWVVYVNRDTAKNATFTLDHTATLYIKTSFDYAGTYPITYTVQIEKGSTPTAYEPYTSTTHTTTYPSAIYRGSEDVVNGEVTTEWSMIASYAGETLPGEWISDRDEYAPGTTPTTGAQVAYELATPTTSSVTPTNLPIRTLSGYNHIESSTGEMEIEYITKTYEPLVELIQSSDHIYSTQEQAVGTWVDGKTLYEKTIVKQNISSASGSTVLIPSSELTGMNIVEIGGSYVSRTKNSTYAINAYINSNTIIATWLSEDDIYYWLYWGAADTYDAYITIRYTKSSSNRSLSAPVTSQKSISGPLTDKTEEVPTEEEKTVEKPETEEETNETER